MDIKELFEKMYAINAPSWSLERDPDGSYKYHATQSAFVLFEQQQIEIESLKVQLEKAQAVLKWNSVDDKEPPLGTMVLICWSDAPDVEPEKDYMDHDVDHGVNYWANYNNGDEPSHWMLLPKPVAQEQSHE